MVAYYVTAVKKWATLYVQNFQDTLINNTNNTQKSVYSIFIFVYKRRVHVYAYKFIDYF